jgi:hypothetical protein
LGKPIAFFVFGIQFLGVGSIFLALVFHASGGLDMPMDYELPGLRETWVLVLLSLPLTLALYGISPKLKNETGAILLLIPVLILNLVLAIQALTVLGTLASYFV